MHMTNIKLVVAGVLFVVAAAGAAGAQQFVARDPGVRGGPAGAGAPLAGLTASQQAFFDAGSTEFQQAEGLSEGLGPRFNLDSCAGCHSQPAVGGTSPATNPQIAAATAFGARNTVPSFLTLDGPVREVRFKRHPDGTPDGGVHALFVISGRVDDSADATGCRISQPNFDRQLTAGNVIFRIPTPVFGAGLIEQIPDATILANQNVSASVKAALGIFGRAHRVRVSGEPNNNGNDGTVARFGWKAQNKSLLLFSGEAYNVEMGVTNELFQTERDETASCQFAATPNATTNTDGTIGTDTISAIERFAFFMRLLEPPQPSMQTPGGAPSIGRGRATFGAVGCALCHTPMLQTGASSVAALSNKPVHLFSDLLLHNMGPGLADEVSQGAAAGDEFRTAPLWGLGQRIFFLHDGRTADLIAAIRAHKSAGNTQFRASEANTVVERFNALPESGKQDLLNFLRSL
jgi:CxxC motif-containing protein (DUF1111 family)